MLALIESLIFHVTLVVLMMIFLHREGAQPVQVATSMNVYLVSPPAVQAAPSPAKAKPLPKPSPKPHAIVRKSITKQISTPQPVMPASSVPAQPPTQQEKLETHGVTITYQPMPKIPDDLREEAFSAYVVARFHVVEDGTATVELITPCQNPHLNHLMLKTLKDWRFMPAIDHGKPVLSTVDIRVRFSVE